jgi:hypothetical protein
MKNHAWINNNPFGFKIGLSGAEGDMYRDKRYDDLIGPKGTEACLCSVCGNMPQTVCEGCLEYLCENHVYRHPNCEEGR